MQRVFLSFAGVLLIVALAFSAEGKVTAPAAVPAPPAVVAPALVVAPAPAPKMVEPVAVAVTSIDHTALLITSIFALITLIVNGLMAWLLKRIDTKAEVAEVERGKLKEQIIATATESETHRADEVARQEETLKVVNTTHTLVNNNMRIALMATATLARRIADITKAPADLAAAEKAEGKVAEHDKGQATVDAGMKVVPVAEERRKT